MIALILAAAAASTPLAIQNVRLEVGNGTVRDRATVIIERGRIASIDGVIPAGARIVDGAGRTLAPGIIATRSEVGIVEVDLEPSGNDSEMSPAAPYAFGPPRPAALLPGFSVAWGFNPESVWIPVVREEGVTSAIVAPSGGVLYGQGAFVSLTGALADRPDPAHPIAMFGGIGSYAASRGGGARGAVWLSIREALADARFYRQNRSAYEKGDARPLSLSPLHLQALLPVIDGEIPFVIDANRASDILDALEFAKAEKLKIVISGGAEAWKVMEQLAAQKVPVILEPSTQEPSSFDSVASRDDLAAVLDKAGVPVVITATGFPSSARRVRQEAGIAVGTGLPHAAAIQAITLAVAKAFGREKEYGSVEIGKRADLVLWSGDPLEIASYVEHVWIGGEEQPMATRQRELFERYKTKAK